MSDGTIKVDLLDVIYNKKNYTSDDIKLASEFLLELKRFSKLNDALNSIYSYDNSYLSYFYNEFMLHCDEYNKNHTKIFKSFLNKLFEKAIDTFDNHFRFYSSFLSSENTLYCIDGGRCRTTKGALTFWVEEEGKNKEFLRIFGINSDNFNSINNDIKKENVSIIVNDTIKEEENRNIYDVNSDNFNNNNIEEELTMSNNNTIMENTFNSIFNVNTYDLGIAFTGELVVKRNEGEFVTYDTEKKEVIVVPNEMVFNDLNNMIMVIPSKKVKEGDIIYRNNTYYKIISVDNEQNEINGINLKDSIRVNLAKETILGMNIYRKVVSLMDFDGNGDFAMNPMMLAMMAGNGNNNSMNNINPLLMMNMMGKSDDFAMNPMMLAMMAGNGNNSNNNNINPLLMMSMMDK